MSDKTFQIEDDPGLEYKPIHPPVVIALGIALFGMLTIAFPIMLIVPCVAALLAILALWKIHRSEYSRSDSVPLGGAAIGKFALFLAMFTIAVSLSHTMGRTWYLHRVVKKHSDVLMETVLAGRYAEGWEYGTEAPARQPKGTDLEKFYLIEDSVPGLMAPPAVMLAAWCESPPVYSIFQDNGKGKLTFLGYEEYTRQDPFWESVGCVYKYESVTPDYQDTFFRVQFMRRVYPSKLGVQWRFRRWEQISGPKRVGEMRILGPAGKKKKEENKKKQDGLTKEQETPEQPN